MTASSQTPAGRITAIRPATPATVIWAAAHIINVNGHHQGDYFPDAFSRTDCRPHAERPLSVVAAVRMAATGSPRTDSMLAADTIRYLAGLLMVDGEQGPYYWDDLSMECHVAAWGDVEGRTAADVVATLLAAASERVAA